MKTDLPPIEEDKVAADAWSWNSKPDFWPSGRSLTSEEIAAMTSDFLAQGGKVEHVEIGVSGCRLEVETVKRTTPEGWNSYSARYADKDMSQRAINERRYSHAHNTAKRMLANGHDVKTIADQVGFTESHVLGIIKAMRERGE